MADTGLIICTDGTQSVSGDVNWTGPGNITVDDTNYATVTLSANEVSEYLYGQNYGFSIPSSATINGVEVAIAGSATQGYGCELYLLKGGAITGTAKIPNFTGSITEQTLGGASEMWGATLAPSDANASEFGIGVYFVNPQPPFFGDVSLAIDYVKIRVYYTEAEPVVGPFPTHFNP